MSAPQSVAAKRVGCLLDRIEMWAERMAEAEANAGGFVPGSLRWDQAKARARKAEDAFNKAMADARALHVATVTTAAKNKIDPETEANARLIAAAPELRRALQEILELHERMAPRGKIATGKLLPEEVANMAAEIAAAALAFIWAKTQNDR